MTPLSHSDIWILQDHPCSSVIWTTAPSLPVPRKAAWAGRFQRCGANVPPPLAQPKNFEPNRGRPFCPNRKPISPNRSASLCQTHQPDHPRALPGLIHNAFICRSRANAGWPHPSLPDDVTTNPPRQARATEPDACGLKRACYRRQTPIQTTLGPSLVFFLTPLPAAAGQTASGPNHVGISDVTPRPLPTARPAKSVLWRHSAQCPPKLHQS